MFVVIAAAIGFYNFFYMIYTFKISISSATRRVIVSKSQNKSITVSY